MYSPTGSRSRELTSLRLIKSSERALDAWLRKKSRFRWTPDCPLNWEKSQKRHSVFNRLFKKVHIYFLIKEKVESRKAHTSLGTCEEHREIQREHTEFYYQWCDNEHIKFPFIRNKKMHSRLRFKDTTVSVEYCLAPLTSYTANPMVSMSWPSRRFFLRSFCMRATKKLQSGLLGESGCCRAILNWGFSQKDAGHKQEKKLDDAI